MTDILSLLGAEGDSLLSYRCTGIPKDSLYLPGPDFVDRVVAETDRKPGVLRALQTLLNHGRLAGTGYLSILPVDQGVEHPAGASFAPNPQYFDPKNIVDTQLTSDNPIDLTRYQVACCYMGRAGLINSGGETRPLGAINDGFDWLERGQINGTCGLEPVDKLTPRAGDGVPLRYAPRLTPTLGSLRSDSYGFDRYRSNSSGAGFIHRRFCFYRHHPDSTANSGYPRVDQQRAEQA